MAPEKTITKKKKVQRKNVLCTVLPTVFESLALFQNIKRDGKADSVTSSLS